MIVMPGGVRASSGERRTGCCGWRGLVRNTVGGPIGVRDRSLGTASAIAAISAAENASNRTKTYRSAAGDEAVTVWPSNPFPV